MRSRTLVLSGFIVFLLCAALPAQQATQPAPQISSLERDRALQMLNTIAGDIRKHYYDPKFHGVDWDARVQQAKERIQTSPTQNAALSHIAGALDALNDSHTFFLPPSRPFLHDYGLQFEAVGDHCYVIRVRPGSDAEAKGVKPGDELLAINGFVPARDNMWQVDYVFHTLRPVLSLRLDLRTPDGQTRQVDAAARYHELQKQKDLGGDGIWDMFRQMEDAARESRLRSVDVGHDLMVLKFRQFAFSQSEIDDLMGKVRKHSALVIDLRENGGGAVETLKYMVEGLFPTEVKVPTRVGRKDSKPMFEKYHPHNPWSGKLVVLVDSRSASASEILARLVQLEKRGVVIGDRSAGAVMESIQYSYQAGMGVTVFYGASITDADIIMSDGKSLEHVGVMPDQLMLATATDMASGRDPVLARAVELAGSKVTPEDAAKFFPYEWPKDKW
jgi:carboxyl-terminal processing protease